MSVYYIHFCCFSPTSKTEVVIYLALWEERTAEYDWWGQAKEVNNKGKREVSPLQGVVMHKWECAANSGGMGKSTLSKHSCPLRAEVFTTSFLWEFRFPLQTCSQTFTCSPPFSQYIGSPETANTIFMICHRCADVASFYRVRPLSYPSDQAANQTSS